MWEYFLYEWPLKLQEQSTSTPTLPLYHHFPIIKVLFFIHPFLKERHMVVIVSNPLVHEYKILSKVLQTLLYCFPSYTTAEDKDDVRKKIVHL